MTFNQRRESQVDNKKIFVEQKQQKQIILWEMLVNGIELAINTTLHLLSNMQ